MVFNAPVNDIHPYSFENKNSTTTSVFYENFPIVTAVSTPGLLERILSYDDIPLILTLFENELPQQVLCENLAFKNHLKVNHGVFQAMTESTRNSRYNIFWKVHIAPS